MKYLESLNEQAFTRKVGNKSVFVVEGLGVAVDKQKAEVAIKAMEDALEKRGYNIQIAQAGRFGFDKRGGWQFDETMTGQGHPESWIPGSRGYYAMSAKSLIFFPKNEMQFNQDKPEGSKLTYKQDLEQAFKRKISVLEEKKIMSKFNKYMEMAKSPKGDVFDTDSYFNSIEPKAGMMTAFELALHVIDNWREITGLPTRAMNREGEFPEEVLALIDDNGIDYQDFVDEFTTMLG